MFSIKFKIGFNNIYMFFWKINMQFKKNSYNEYKNWNNIQKYFCLLPYSILTLILYYPLCTFIWFLGVLYHVKNLVHFQHLYCLSQLCILMWVLNITLSMNACVQPIHLYWFVLTVTPQMTLKSEIFYLEHVLFQISILIEWLVR